MSKLKAFNELFIGKPEINRMIEFLGDLGYKKIIAEMTKEFGVINDNRSVDFTSLQIYNSSTGKIGIRAGKAIDASGNLIQVEEDIPDVITLVDNSIYQKVFIQYAETNLEKYKINIIGDFIYGDPNDDFTEKFSLGSIIQIVNSISGNNGVYEVIAVNNSNEIQIDTTLTSEDNVGYIVQGRYTPSVIIPEEEKRPFYLDSFILSLEDSEEVSSNSKFILANVMRSGSAVTVQDQRMQNMHVLKESYIRPFDSAFTTATSFKVGADESGVGGRYVLLEPDVPADLLNLRIFDIYGNRVSNIDPTYTDGKLVSRQLINGVISPTLNVRIKWGWDYITGTGGSNSFTITNIVGEEYQQRLPNLTGVVASGVFVNNILAGCMLWVPQVSKLLRITANTGNSLVVEEQDGSSIDLTGVNPNSANPAWITVDADKYTVVAIPYDSTGITPIKTERIEQQVYYSESPAMIEKILQLEIAKRYLIKVKAHLLNKETDFFEMPSGYYYKYGVQQNYAKPALIIHPQISSSGASIGAVATANGFRVTINGWANANHFEICYTTDNAGASFENELHPKIVTANRLIDITTSQSAGYNVKVRPIISGQEVATPLSTNVISGSAGVPPNSVVLVNQEINLRTYSGTINFDGADTGTLSNIRTPSGGSLVVTSLPTSNVGKIMTISGQNYLIVHMFSGTSVFIQPYTNDDGTLATLPSAGNHTFSISTSKRGRRIISSILPQDFDLTRLEVDCNYLVGDDVTLRVYQLSKESLADYLLLEDNDTPYGVYLDAQILGSYGQRVLVVDLWDPEDYPTVGDPQKNTGGLTGRVIVYGLPRVGGITPILVDQ